MKEHLHSIDSLVDRIRRISKFYNDRDGPELIEIFEEFDLISSDLYNTNPNMWHGLFNGMRHTEDCHIYILKDYKVSKSNKTNSYRSAYDYILTDLEIVRKALSSKE